MSMDVEKDKHGVVVVDEKVCMLKIPLRLHKKMKDRRERTGEIMAHIAEKAIERYLEGK